MKIEYLPDGSEACPLVRLFDFKTSEIAELLAACRALHDGPLGHYRLDAIRSLESIGGCQLSLEAGVRDRGLVLVAPPAEFRWVLSRLTWDNVEGLLAPFEKHEIDGFQWLDSIGEASLLISRDGSW
jgi:hypothetical protein